MARRLTPEQRNARHAAILDGMRRGLTQVEIGRALDPPVSGVIVHKEIRRIRQELARQNAATYEELVAPDVDRLDRVIGAHWDAATAGDPDASAVVLRALALRTKLTGVQDYFGARGAEAGKLDARAEAGDDGPDGGVIRLEIEMVPKGNRRLVDTWGDEDDAIEEAAE